MKQKFHWLYIDREGVNRSATAKLITHTKIEEICRRENLNNNVIVDSAGLEESWHSDLTPEMKGALSLRRYETSLYSHQVVTRELLYAQNLILCFTQRQIHDLLIRFDGKEGIVNDTFPGYAGFPDREIKDFGVLIRQVPLFSGLQYCPHPIRLMYYFGLGKTDPRDEKAVMRLHINLIKTLEMYVDLAIQRMRREGLILGSTE